MQIHDFDNFSWALVQDFSKINTVLERCRSVFAIFVCFLGFDSILERCRRCFGILPMLLLRFFNFSSVFINFDRHDPDFDAVWTRYSSVFGTFGVQIP